MDNRNQNSLPATSSTQNPANNNQQYVYSWLQSDINDAIWALSNDERNRNDNNNTLREQGDYEHQRLPTTSTESSQRSVEELNESVVNFGTWSGSQSSSHGYISSVHVSDASVPHMFSSQESSQSDVNNVKDQRVPSISSQEPPWKKARCETNPSYSYSQSSDSSL